MTDDAQFHDMKEFIDALSAKDSIETFGKCLLWTLLVFSFLQQSLKKFNNRKFILVTFLGGNWW